MRCALLLPGHMRHYKKTFANQNENIIGPNNCDVFISTSNLVTNWISDHNFVTEEQDMGVLEKEIYSVYGDRLKGLVINHEENIDIIPSPMQWKRLKECFDQKTLYEKEGNFTYDAVLRARTDLIYSNQLKIDKTNLKDNKVSLLRHFDRRIPVHDQFAYGHSESMEKYSDLINVFAPRDVGGRSEEQLHRWLLENDIDIDYIENFYFKMVRGRN